MHEIPFWQVIILGIVQGITEFLPVSSDGHLALLQNLFGIHEHVLTLTIVLHFGTLLSILLVYRHDLLPLLKQWKLCALIVLATIPAGFVGLTLKSYIEQASQVPWIAAAGLIATAVLLLVGQYWERNRDGLEKLGPAQALLIGLFQTIAILPGVSRSGSTISAGLMTGLRRDAATTFSFFIAIPVLAGACLLEGKDLLAEHFPPHVLWMLAAGALTSFVVGVAALQFLIRLVKQRQLHWFAYYCLALAAVTFVWQASTHVTVAGH